jgi:uncharacterized protein with PQ loop repeat
VRNTDKDSAFVLSTVLTFIPQYTKILEKNTCDGISLYYLVLNLIIFTEQFAVYLHLILVAHDAPTIIVDSPPSVLDYLNLLQFGVTWFCFLIL